MNKKRLKLISGVVLSIATLLAGTWWLTNNLSPPLVKGKTYETGFGEQRTETLVDGTKIELDSNTSVYVAFLDETPSIMLTKGQTYLVVAEGVRPIKISGGTGEVTAQAGTSIEMRVQEDQMVVSVDKGQITVNSRNSGSKKTTLSQLERLEVANNNMGNIQKLDSFDGDWRDGWLEYKDVLLGEVIADLDKYYKGSVRLENANLSQLPITARLKISEAGKAIRIVAKSMRLEMSTSEEGDITLYQGKK